MAHHEALRRYGCKEFVVALGYKGDVIKRYFSTTAAAGDLTVDLGDGACPSTRRARDDDWTVHLVDTGLETDDRRPREAARAAIFAARPFMLTYGDGVSDVTLDKLLAFHKRTAGWRP